MSNWPKNGNLTGKLSVGQGERGKSLEYEWRGTELGIRQEGASDYQYVNLKGEQGLPGKDGKNGLDGTNGINGQDGANGKDGITPNITIGTVTTLEAGQQAIVTKEGTNENPIFNFSIPKGADGTGGNNIIPTTIEIVDNILTLTTDRYQLVDIKDNTTIVLPEVEDFTEISLVFKSIKELTVLFPSNIGWSTYPSVAKNKINKFTFTYINNEWIGDYSNYMYYDFNTPIMDGLILWLDGYDLPTNSNNIIPEDTVWRNKIEGRGDAIIKSKTTGISMNKESGYFNTNGNGYIILPSFSANHREGISTFIDAKINEMPTAKYTKLFTIGYSIHYYNMFAMEFGTEEFGKVRNFEFMTNTGILGEKSTATFPMSVKVGVTTETAKNFRNDVTLKCPSTTNYDRIFSNNFLNAETPTNLFAGNISYGLVLIYNRKLTEEEMLHNYIYSNLIERG